MMISIALAVAILAAVVAVGLRRLQRARQAHRRPGATIHRAVVVRGFDEIDAALTGRACTCGGRLRALGESSRVVAQRRFRVVRLVCTDCGQEERVHFDVTAIFH